MIECSNERQQREPVGSNLELGLPGPEPFDLDGNGSERSIRMPNLDLQTIGDFAQPLSTLIDASSNLADGKQVQRSGSSTRPKQGPHLAHVCDTKGCGKAFARKPDLRRHVNSKHVRTSSFLCPATGCFKKQERRSFPRVDKLKAHLRAMHDSGTTSECMQEGCSHTGPLALSELHVHLRLQHGMGSHHSRSLPVPSWYCPIKPCTVAQAQKSLFDHILEHVANCDTARLVAAVESLRKQNILLVAPSLGVSQAEDCYRSMEGRSSDTFTNVHLRCPVCHAHCVDKKAFEKHMVAMHLADTSNRKHANDTYYLGYRRHACSNMYRTDLSDLKPYRGQILELYHCFAYQDRWRPVWDDVISPSGNRAAATNEDVDDQMTTAGLEHKMIRFA